MVDAEILSEVKKRMAISGDYQDDIIQGYIEDVKFYMQDAGVKDEVINSAASIGAIARGVSDLWYNDGKLSQMFFQRVKQLYYRR